MDLITNGHSIEVGIRELKNQLSHYIDQVCAGTEIIVTEHGKPVARLTALTEADEVESYWNGSRITRYYKIK